eukprot:NODE_547_length_6851_cov_0.322867.p4 type:complete len:167 gc:universal NODE_547_length_6851_cov_0.322867:3338-3838(+)
MKRLRIIISSDYQSTFYELLNEATPQKSKSLDEGNCIIYSTAVRMIRKSLPFDFKVQSIFKSKLCYERKNWIVIVDNCTLKIFERFDKYSKRFNIIILTNRVTVDPKTHEYIYEDRSSIPANKYIRNVYEKLAEEEYGGNCDPFEYKSKLKKRKSSPLKKQILRNK